ncbi:Vac7p Ecym_3293 [Eremothecium cymbalariae DBVPG|uniref:Vacuolar segregation protein 7 n=1 Tax=Eremothecium cymbalariae (strain CBS 270.75 / DBVPG 7215 / KCTC 17166 / NRRL Y-17582) TaxID=931890 RepID=G8JRL7_ERECY|nr:Hypothetical protein Ecym_3293 [Eremothecium cymbalariae DBVPG\
MVIDEESRIIVETETVDTQTQPLLPVQPPLVASISEQAMMHQELLHSRQSSSHQVLDGQLIGGLGEAVGTGAGGGQQSSDSLEGNGSGNVNVNVNGYGGVGNQDRKSLLLAEDRPLLKESMSQQHFGSTVVGQGSQQPPVIAHNPLSPHASMTALRNKKSSLLIDSLPAAGETLIEDEARENESGSHGGIGGGGGGGGSSIHVGLASSNINHGSSSVHTHPGITHTEGGSTTNNGSGAVGSDVVGGLNTEAFSTRTLDLQQHKPYHHMDKSVSGRLDEESRSGLNYGPVESLIDQDSVRQGKESSTKADFFAARLASAVGENEISDSEETFVYESTANSTKNSYEPISSNVIITQPSLTKPYGIPAKLSTPMLNKNKKLMERLKTSRHSSIAVIPPAASDTIASIQAINPAQQQPQQHLQQPQPQLQQLQPQQPQDPPPAQQQQLPQLQQQPQQQHQQQQVLQQQQLQTQQQLNLHHAQSLQQSSQQSQSQQQQSQPHYVHSQALSDDLKSIHSSKQRRAQQPHAGQSDILSVKSYVTNQQMHSPGKRLGVLSLGKVTPEARPSRNMSTHSGKLRPSYNSGNTSTYKLKNNHLYPFRTTASRIFDANGASLRRYSGVPDDINLEDYVEQENGELTPNKFTYRSSSEMESEDDEHALDEEEGLSYVEEDEDDVQSMFYYHGNAHTNSTNHQNNNSNGNKNSAGNELNNNTSHSNEKNQNNGSHQSLHRRYRTHYGAIDKYTQSSQKLNYSQTEPNMDVPGDDDLEALYYFRNNSNHNNNNRDGNANAEPGNKNGHGSKHLDFFFQPDELVPLKPKKRRSHTVYSGYYNPHNFYTKRSNWNKFKSFVYLTFIVTSLLALGFISGFLLATNKELHDFQITLIDNVLVSTDELVFDVSVSSFNPGFFTIGVQDVDLDIFAKTAHLDDPDNGAVSGDQGKSHGSSYETILLGTVYSLESPLRFPGGLFSRNHCESMSSIKLLHPGATDNEDEGTSPLPVDPTYPTSASTSPSTLPSTTTSVMHHKENNIKLPLGSSGKKTENDAEKWKTLIRYDFDLIIRGSMKYNVPFFKSEKSVVVQAQVNVDPNWAKKKVQL